MRKKVVRKKKAARKTKSNVWPVCTFDTTDLRFLPDNPMYLACLAIEQYIRQIVREELTKKGKKRV